MIDSILPFINVKFEDNEFMIGDDHTLVEGVGLSFIEAVVDYCNNLIEWEKVYRENDDE